MGFPAPVNNIIQTHQDTWSCLSCGNTVTITHDSLPANGSVICPTCGSTYTVTPGSDTIQQTAGWVASGAVVPVSPAAPGSVSDYTMTIGGTDGVNNAFSTNVNGATSVSAVVGHTNWEQVVFSLTSIATFLSAPFTAASFSVSFQTFQPIALAWPSPNYTPGNTSLTVFAHRDVVQGIIGASWTTPT